MHKQTKNKIGVGSENYILFCFIEEKKKIVKVFTKILVHYNRIV